MWLNYHFIFMYFCQPTAWMHFIASICFLPLALLSQTKLNKKDIIPALCLVGMYVGFQMTRELYHFAFLPWWTVTIVGLRDKEAFIWTGGIITGLLLFVLTWKQRIGHVIMNVSRMLRVTTQSIWSYVIIHLALVIINISLFDDNAQWNENGRIYVDILAGISCVLCSLWKDDMEWFSIIMIFTNPLGLSLGVLHLMCPYWYKYYENNHFRMVKYNAYYLCPIAIFLVLCVREGLLSVSTST